MQAADRTLAHRYALALFHAGLARKEEERIHADLSETLKLLRGRMDVFRHPVTGAAKQKTILKNMVGSRISARTLGFLELLIDKKRFFLLPPASAEYGALLDAHKGLIRAQVRSAARLSEPEQERLRRDLGAFSGKDVALDVKESPELLGGLVVRMGDWVLDGSLQGKLRRLAAQLVEEQ